jgi:hypothetical protein
MESVTPETRQTVRVAVMDYLREQAGLDQGYGGNFSAPRYNKALRGLDAKLPSIFDAATLEQLRSTGNVARYVTEQPRGSYVNNSNTFVSALSEHGATALEKTANTLAGGLPVGTAARNFLRKTSAEKQAQNTLATGAGVRRKH